MKFNYIFPKFVIFFSVLLMIGLCISNKVILSLAILCLLSLVIGLLIEMPNDISIKRLHAKSEIPTNTVFENKVEITINKGFGVVYLSDLLPQELELVEGSNYMVVFKGFGPLKVNMTYKVRAANACVIILKSFFYESRHFLELLKTQEKQIRTEQKLVFSPSTTYFKDIRNVSVLAKLFSYQFAKARFGIPTMDFKGLRAYTVEDSIKYINWKATARNINSFGEYFPVVNEFEKEGMYNVWFLLDYSNNMLYGSNLKNMLNYSMDTILNLSEYYLKKNANIAFCTFSGNETFLYPNSGKNQYFKLLRETKKFADLNKDYNKLSKKPFLDLRETVFKYSKYFNGYNPFFIIFTRIIPENLDKTLEGIRECFKYVPKNTKRKLPIMVVNLNGHVVNEESDLDEELSLEFLRVRDKHLVSKTFKNNMIWVDWDPFERDFFTTLTKSLRG